MTSCQGHVMDIHVAVPSVAIDISKSPAALFPKLIPEQAWLSALW